MEKSPASSVANAISNGDKRGCSHRLGEGRGENGLWTGSECLGSKPDFPSLESRHLLSAWRTGCGLMMGWKAGLHPGNAQAQDPL